MAEAARDGRLRKVRLVADPYPPYQYEEGGEVKGVDQEVIREAFRVHGLEAETRLLPWRECLEWMERGRADGIFQIAPNPQRREQWLFSALLRTETTVLFRRRGSGAELRGAGPEGADAARGGGAAPGLRLGVLEGYSYDPFIDGLKEPARVACKSQEHLLQALAEGQVDLALMDAGVAAWLMRERKLEGIERAGDYRIARPLHVAFQKDRRETARLFDSGLAAVRARGLAGRIWARYGLQPG